MHSKYIFYGKKPRLPKLVQLNAILLLGFLVGFFALAGLVQQFIYQRIILALMNKNCMKVWKLRFQLHASFFFPSNQGNCSLKTTFIEGILPFCFMNNPWTDVDFYKFSCYLKLFEYFIQTYCNLWVICIFFVLLQSSTIHYKIDCLLIQINPYQCKKMVGQVTWVYYSWCKFFSKKKKNI